MKVSLATSGRLGNALAAVAKAVSRETAFQTLRRLDAWHRFHRWLAVIALACGLRRPEPALFPLRQENHRALLTFSGMSNGTI